MTLSWISVDANNGSVIADLPNLVTTGALKQTIGRHETLAAILPLDGIPANWRTATRKKSAFLVALDEGNGPDRGLPVWGGMVIDRETSHTEGVPLSLVTAEDYLNDRYVGDETFTAKPQNTIVRTLVEKYVVPNGLPLRVVELAGANPPRDRTYQDQADKTVFSVLDELSGVIGGPEWTITWEWVDAQRLGMVLWVGERLGSPAPDGLGPSAQFYLPGNVSDAILHEGYKRGEGANDVMATSSGVDDARPQSGRKQVLNDGRPRVEFRWSPSSSITDTATLDGHANRALAAMQDGTVELAIEAPRATAPAFALGDTIGFDLTSWAWPDGITGTARVISVERTDTTITPILDVTGIEGID